MLSNHELLNKINKRFKQQTKQYIILSIILSIGLYLFFNFLRNEWYLNFYQAIEKRMNINRQVIIFIIIAAMIILNDFFKGFMKTKFISQARKKNFDQQIKNNEIDYAQRICEDQRFSAEYFINAIDSWCMGFGIILIFLPRMFFLIGWKNYTILIILFAYSLLLFLFNFGYIKRILQTKLYKFEESEGELRKFLATWFNKHCLRPINFSWKYFKNAKKNMEKYFTTKLIINAVQGLYENVGLIIPFIAFYNLYSSNKISLPSLFQLINLWTNINYAITNIVKGIENYICFDITKKRLEKIEDITQITIQNDLIDNIKNIELKNISISIKQKNSNINIIQNFSLDIKKGEHVNIVAKNGMGKTTLMHAMQNIKKYDGKMILPEGIIWIPEQPVITANFIKEIENNKFENNCNIINLDLYKKDYEKLSGAEMWKAIAAYAMCFEYVIWDDPFWGVDIPQEYIQILLKNIDTILIFSQTPIENMRIVNLK